jgi:phospholipid/cholesterol/gamma-HCH transport system ATP-binding protein
MEIITFKDVYKKLGNKQVLSGMDLTIRKGEIMVIIGGSGEGKSVTLKHMMGLMQPDTGEVWVENECVTTMNEESLYQIRSKFGMLFQYAALFDSLNVRENVGFALDEHTDLTEEAKARIVAEKLELVHLAGIEHMMPSELSGGMKKRVGLARAMARDPQILLYDEPTTGLDPINSDVINNLIIELNEKLGVTSIVVTHDMQSVFKIAHRIAMLYKGRIIKVGDKSEFLNPEDPIVRQFVRGEAHGPITDEINNSMVK